MDTNVNDIIHCSLKSGVLCIIVLIPILYSLLFNFIILINTGVITFYGLFINTVVIILNGLFINTIVINFMVYSLIQL